MFDLVPNSNGLIGTLEQQLDAFQVRSADQTLSKRPDGYTEGQFALVLTQRFKPMTGGRHAAHPPVPVAPGREPLDRERPPDTEGCPDVTRRLGPDVPEAAFRVTTANS